MLIDHCHFGLQVWHVLKELLHQVALRHRLTCNSMHTFTDIDLPILSVQVEHRVLSWQPLWNHSSVPKVDGNGEYSEGGAMSYDFILRYQYLCGCFQFVHIRACCKHSILMSTGHTYTNTHSREQNRCGNNCSCDTLRL